MNPPGPAAPPQLPMDADDMAAHADDAARLLRALANPHRLMVLCLLGQGEMSVGQINEQVPLAQSALSQHLAVLRRDGLVNTRRLSQTIYYSLNPGPAADIIAVLHGHFCRQ